MKSNNVCFMSDSVTLQGVGTYIFARTSCSIVGHDCYYHFYYILSILIYLIYFEYQNLLSSLVLVINMYICDIALHYTVL